LFYNVRILIK